MSRSRSLRIPPSLVAPALVALALAVPVPARADDGRTAPSLWLEAFRQAYESRNLTAYADLLADDFRYEFGDSTDRARWPAGWGRDDELASARHLFEGFVDRAGVARPPAVEIALALGGVAFADDPDHPGDREHFALAVAARAVLTLRFADGSSTQARGRQAFWLVRGDLDPGCRSHDAGCWQVRRWAEDPPDSALAPRPGADLARLPGAPGAPRVAPNPARAGERVVLLAGTGDAPGEVSAVVYDVRGRRVADLAAGRAAAGAWTLAWDGRGAGGAPAGPGVYFARVRVGAAGHVLRIVRVP